MPYPDRHIDALLDNVDQPIGEQAAPVHGRIAIQIVEQDRQHIDLAEDHRSGDDQRASGIAAAASASAMSANMRRQSSR